VYIFTISLDSSACFFARFVSQVHPGALPRKLTLGALEDGQALNPRALGRWASTQPTLLTLLAFLKFDINNYWL
jgi:hypothetical protein